MINLSILYSNAERIGRYYRRKILSELESINSANSLLNFLEFGNNFLLVGRLLINYVSYATDGFSIKRNFASLPSQTTHKMNQSRCFVHPSNPVDGLTMKKQSIARIFGTFSD